MKKALTLLVTVLLAFSSCQKDESLENPNLEFNNNKKPNKVNVCHYDAEYDIWKTLNISENTVNAHLNHGDYLGECITIPVEGLVAYYPFNNNVNDESGNGYHGVQNGPMFIADRFGNTNSALGFTDSGNARVSLGTDLNPTNMANITVAAWINLQVTLTNSGDGEHQTILGQGNGTGSSANYPFWFLITASGRMGLKKNGPSIESAPFLYPDDNQWHFLVGTVDGNQATLYLDGVEIDSGTTGTPGGPNYNLSIGNLGETSGVYGNTFNGFIDDVRIYDRAITPIEVQDLYNE